MQTVVELPEYLRQVENLLSESEREDIKAFLGSNPQAGAVIKGTKGIRKIRWKRENAGKSGGYRVIYFYHNEYIPVFLLTAYGKNVQGNLSKAERNALARVAEQLKNYGRKNHE